MKKTLPRATAFAKLLVGLALLLIIVGIAPWLEVVARGAQFSAGPAQQDQTAQKGQQSPQQNPAQNPTQAPRPDNAQGGQAPAAPPAQSADKSSDAKRVDLGKFVSVATTPVGLVIAGAIILSFFEQKRGASSAQMRALVHELRAEDISGARRRALIDEVNVYKNKLASTYIGSQFVVATLVLFILTNIGASLGLIWPDAKIFDVMVIGGMMLVMVCLASSLVTEMYDSWHSRRELSLELRDFDRVAARPELIEQNKNRA